MGHGRKNPEDRFSRVAAHMISPYKTKFIPGHVVYVCKYISGALPPQHTFATASTGVAACHIGGTTLHAFAGKLEHYENLPMQYTDNFFSIKN